MVMGTGLQIFDGAGRVILDARSRAGRVVGIAWTGGGDGSVAADMSGGEPFWSFMPAHIFYRVSGAEPSPIIAIDRNGLSWRYSGNTSGSNAYTQVPGWIVYGVY
ncbi:gp21 [Burkholderia thailandensis E264]|uniref:Gp21 n=2 Tax=Burkholderia thailandensis TaxID=57975 RepID=Q2T6D9_BURTA|nr:gp21 [Burkholderia thailandensis E264]PHH34173.1 hypothetical protein CRX59_26395 [Burkholderia thailandensis]PNE83901.1 hypothetical protein A8H34_07095 [Burkholderia thailandensis]PNE90185.1 hypothetical protein A8H30_08860 [Burkholderia thailandensis]